MAEETTLSTERRIGRDELNLTEFPFALVASRPGKEVTYRMEFRDGDKEWIVEGSPTYGLPTASDVEVYVVLMELTRQQNFPVQVTFTRHEVLKRLGWDPNGHCYERFVRSLDRLVAVTIRSKNAFYDASERRWERKKAFHILEEYDLTDSRLARPDEPSLFPSWIRWGQELYRNLQAGYIKSLDVDLFLSLESAISQALYRYLDAKRYDGKPSYRIGLKKLAWEHLGLSRNYYPSQIKRKLDAAHQELIDVGFLANAEYAPMKSGDEMVVYRFAPRSGKGERSPAPVSIPESPIAAPPVLPALSPLAQRLVDAGTSRQSAVELAAAAPDECTRQLEFLSFRNARDPGAVLVKAIREGWAAPPAWVEAQKQAEVKEKTRTARAAKRKPAPVVEPGTESAFDSWYQALSPLERETLEAEAMTQLRKENRVMAEFAAKHPNSPMVRDTLRPYLEKLSRRETPSC